VSKSYLCQRPIWFGQTMKLSNTDENTMTNVSITANRTHMHAITPSIFCNYYVIPECEQLVDCKGCSGKVI
jgi:hypothetical protein